MKRLAILAAIAAAPPALGQQTPYVLPEITLTANREQTEIGRSGSSVSVIVAAALAASTLLLRHERYWSLGRPRQG